MEIGERFGGRYEVQRLLGAGGIASVYLVEDRVLGGEVALKVLHAHLRDDAAVVEAFRREVAVSRLLDHPAVARIHELGRDEATGAVYLSMEYFPGGDLRHRLLRSGALPTAVVVRVGRDVLGALGAAHALGIVHRDLKPHNILIDAEGSYHLSDFGLARSSALFGLESGLRVAGTPEYLAPESLESGYADSRSDLYSMGVVLFEAATGRLPFRAGSAYELLRMHAEEPPPEPWVLNPGLPRGLGEVLLRLLEKDPARRFQSAEELAEALERGEARALPAASAAHPCPACGEPVPDGFPYCFACRREPLFLAPSRSATRRGRCRVVVTGPGKPGDQLGQELRQRCLGLLRDLDADPKRLERHLPRVPFVLLRDLDPEGARLLAERLRGLGLEVTVDEGGRSPERKALRRRFRRKDAIIAGRVLAVTAAMSGGSFQGLGRALFQPGAHWGIALLVLLGLVLTAVPVATILANRRTLVRWAPSGGREALRRYLELAPQVHSPPLQGLMRRVVLRLGELRRLAQKEEAAREVTEAAEALVLQAADWIEACQAAEDRLGDERGLYREVADLRRLPGAPEGGGAVAEAERKIDLRRGLERQREVLLDRLLSFSARLDGLWASLGSLGAHGAAQEVRELEKAAEEVSLAVKAVRDVEEVV